MSAYGKEQVLWDVVEMLCRAVGLSQDPLCSCEENILSTAAVEGSWSHSSDMRQRLAGANMSDRG